MAHFEIAQMKKLPITGSC